MGPQPGKVYRSTNDGNQWYDMSVGLLNGSGSINCLAINSKGRIFAGNSGVWRTNISSISFTLFGSLLNLNTQVLFGTPAVSIINFIPPENLLKQNFIPNVADVEISIDEVLHTRTGDLTFTLDHLGVVDTIIIEAGGNGQDFISTLLSDDSDDQIENGTAPFTGFYKPSRPLDLFSGLDPYGEWKLSIIDGYAGNDGTLNAWSLQIDLDSPILNLDDNLGLTPGHFALYQNYPNPFNPSTKIKFQIVEFGFVTLKVYDVLGNEIANLVNEELSTGTYDVTFDASHFASGIYFYKIQAGNFVETKKMLMIK
jgi:subtilisin-like proprotein convertase family protein